MYPDLNVAENIFIAHADRGPWVDWGRLYRDAEEILAQLDVRLDVRQPARGLSVAAQQTVEIAKALSLQVRVLIMDEPTAALSAHEVDQLFAIVQRLRDQGVAVLFISHHLEEVFRLADRITVFRDGRLISSALRNEITPEQAIRDMAGRSIEQLFPRRDTVRDRVLVQVRDLGRTGVFSGISFDVREGEVLGFAGLVGARRTDVGLALFGIAPADRGTMTIDGHPVRITNPTQAMRYGIAYVSEDRRGLGLSLPMSIAAKHRSDRLHPLRHARRAGWIPLSRPLWQYHRRCRAGHRTRVSCSCCGRRRQHLWRIGHSVRCAAWRVPDRSAWSGLVALAGDQRILA